LLLPEMSMAETHSEAMAAVTHFLGEAGWLLMSKSSFLGGPMLWTDPRTGMPYRTDHAYMIECERGFDRKYQAQQKTSPETKQAIMARRKDRLIAAHDWVSRWVKSIQLANGMTKHQIDAAEEHLENIRLAAEEGEL
jgi:nitrate/TMAO reductase-like tetraheme cytochrome c subunit